MSNIRKIQAAAGSAVALLAVGANVTPASTVDFGSAADTQVAGEAVEATHAWRHKLSVPASIEQSRRQVAFATCQGSWQTLLVFNSNTQTGYNKNYNSQSCSAAIYKLIASSSVYTYPGLVEEPALGFAGFSGPGTSSHVDYRTLNCFGSSGPLSCAQRYIWKLDADFVPYEILQGIATMSPDPPVACVATSQPSGWSCTGSVIF